MLSKQVKASGPVAEKPVALPAIQPVGVGVGVGVLVAVGDGVGDNKQDIAVTGTTAVEL